jgi:hypothetical protein
MELHAGVTMKMHDADDLTTLLRHIWVNHSFKVFRTHTNQGWTQDRVVLPELLRRGLRPRTCCYNLHMWRAAPCADAPALPPTPTP